MADTLELIAARDQIERLREALGLAQSMIYSGERMTPKAEAVFKAALDGGEGVKP